MKKTGWIMLGVVVVLVLWLFSGYNGMVDKQQRQSWQTCRHSISVVPI